MGNRTPSAIICVGMALAAFLIAQPGAARSSGIAENLAVTDAWLVESLEGLVQLYRHLHAHPELSLKEEQTAAVVARLLEASGYAVEIGVGGHGVVGVLENGPGPTLMIRGDMDALPVREETGLAYASVVEEDLPDGRSVGVMHACGHDVHVTNLVGVADLLAASRERWSGNLVIVAQPAEELGRGALAMMNDGLWKRVPRPDTTLALHVEPDLPSGQVGLVSGWAAANVDAVDITIFGRGGHGARPQTTVDPIVTAAHLVTALQTIVSRRIDPREPAVVTVGSIHGGHKHNVIPDQVHLQLTVRSYSDEVRSQLLDGIRQLSEDICRGFGCPTPPEIAIRQNYTPAVYNDPGLSARAVATFREAFGDDQVVEVLPTMGGEDFGRYSRDLGVPGLIYRLGATDPQAFAASQVEGGSAIPSLHSSRFAPDAERTIRTGIRSMSLLALEILSPTP